MPDASSACRLTSLPRHPKKLFCAFLLCFCYLFQVFLSDSYAPLLYDKNAGNCVKSSHNNPNSKWLQNILCYFRHSYDMIFIISMQNIFKKEGIEIMTNGQKTILGCSVVSYLLVLYSFFRFDLWLILLFFILHSLVLLTLAFLFWKNNLEDNDLIEMQARYQKAAADNEQAADTLRGKLDEQIRLCEKKDQELIDARLRIRALDEELTGVRASADSAKAALAEAAENENAYEALLPPADPNEDPNETIDIIQIARDTISELTDFAKKAHLDIVLSAPDSTMLVKASRERLRILFRNIIDNSIKYMNRSGSLLITISSIGDDIFIVLKDNGNGLSERETKHIFELNYQGTNRVSGNGLGLTQAKAIVDYYGGSIYAKSMIGRGMGIYIQLPTT